MDAVITLLQKVLPVFVVLFLGILCRKRSLLTREGINALKKVAVDIALPAVMFSSFATAEYTLSSICVPLIMFAVCCIALFIGFRLCRGMKIGGRLSPFITAGFEAGMLGYTLFAILFGEEMRPAFAIVDLGQVLFVFTVYKVLLAGKNNVGDALKEALSAPTVCGKGYAVQAEPVEADAVRNAYRVTFENETEKREMTLCDYATGTNLWSENDPLLFHIWL